MTLTQNFNLVLTASTILFAGCQKQSDVLNLSCDVDTKYTDQVGLPTATTEIVKEKIFYQLRKANYEERGNESSKKVFDWVLTENQKREMHSDKDMTTTFKRTALNVDSEKIHYKDETRSSEPSYFVVEELTINRVTGSVEGYLYSNFGVKNYKSFSGQCIKVDEPKF